MTSLPPLLMIDDDNIVALASLVLTRGPEPDGRVASYYLHRPGAEPLEIKGEVAAALQAFVTGKLPVITHVQGSMPISFDLMASWEGQQKYEAHRQQHPFGSSTPIGYADPAQIQQNWGNLVDPNVPYDLKTPLPKPSRASQAVPMRPLKRVEPNPALTGTGVMGDPEYDPPVRSMAEEIAAARAALGEKEENPRAYVQPRVSSPGMPMLLDEAFVE